MFLVVLTLLVLAGRLFSLQYIQYDYYWRYAEENQLQRERIIAPRGLIKDRNAVVLVDNVPRFNVIVPSRDRAHVRETVFRLGEYLPLDTTIVFSRYRAWLKRNGTLPFPIISNANKLQISFVRENYDMFPTLRVKTSSQRRYRNGEFASHLLGYVGEVSNRFLSQTTRRGYFAGDLIGKIGIEEICEEFLRGEDGQRVVAVTAHGAILGELNELTRAPVPGRDVLLTIDTRLQGRLESLIEPWESGAAVVMDVNDGSILAVVSLPNFDPNKFARGISQVEWNELFNAESKPLFNRFLRATYPPGSVLKIISAHANLEYRIEDPDDAIVFCISAYRFGNRVFKCWKRGGHGWMNLMNGFVQSCDSYFYKIGEGIDVDELAASARDYGLGVRTGIDMPGEVRGLVPDRAYYNRRYGENKWTQGYVLNNVIGQGEFLVSVLQMVRVAASVANGGYLVQPHVIKQVDGESEGVYRRRRVPNMNATIITFLQKAMESVVQGERGTGRASRIRGITAAGKTGTSQNPHGDDHAWFVGYAPSDEPEIAIAVIVENAGHGGAVAAPIAGKFYMEYFKDRIVVTQRIAPRPKPPEKDEAKPVEIEIEPINLDVVPLAPASAERDSL